MVLQLAGGFGVGPVEKLFCGLWGGRPLEVVVVAGRNEELEDAAGADRAVRRGIGSQVLGFTTQIDELMAAADLVVSKPGGLTTSETLARGAAMAIVNPIPGQESRNSDFLLENGAAIKINNVATLPYKLTQLLARPGPAGPAEGQRPAAGPAAGGVRRGGTGAGVCQDMTTPLPGGRGVGGEGWGNTVRHGI